MPNLSVVSLSVNRISSLKDFAKCPNLQVNPFLKEVTLPQEEQHHRHRLNPALDQATQSQSAVAA